MKHAVSISIGSSQRNKTTEINLFGEQVRLERIGTDGDMEKAAALYREMDGNVDAFGVGGALLGFMIGRDWYTLHSVQNLIRHVKHTPVVDGTGLKMTLEYQAAQVVDDHLKERIVPRTALLISQIDRYGLSRGFIDAGYDYRIGDLMFTLGIPMALRTEASLRLVVKLLLPIAGRLPFSWLYPTGESQNIRKPRWGNVFKWASVITGDCHYITHYMPDDMRGKVVVTNTTTPEDRELFRHSGVKALITTTPILDGRSFGTNMLEAAIVAALGRRDPVDYAHPGDYFDQMKDAVSQLGLQPQFQEL